jgi:uncharacterized protein YsxB (DUF464 family)
MITAIFYKKSGNLSGFKVSGHAEYDDIGFDIVCAGVTSAVQLTANLITESFGIKAEVVAQDNIVSLKVENVCEVSSKLIDGLRNHLELISQQFEGTISLKISEV